jgi:hypothetical protein
MPPIEKMLALHKPESYPGDKMIIKFTGGEARTHKVEAYSGAESLTGFARAATLAAHFSVTGEVRFRAPYSDNLQYYFEAPNPGSLEFVFSQICRLGNDAAQLAAKVKSERLLERVIARATGQAEMENLELDEQVIDAGTIDALTEAATPGLVRAHSWIDTDDKAISIVKNARELVRLDDDTKEYINSEEMGEERVQDVSVGALNVNSKVGRVFFHDLRRTVPFKVARTAHNRTVTMLSRYLTQYAEKTGATVNIRFVPIYYPDRRLKKILIFDCYGIEDRA